jgi:hypothetical protein
MKKNSLIVLFAVLFMSTQAQKITFLSEGFERGVRTYLQLDSGEEITQAHVDTITAIDLSGLGIEDISDVGYFPNVRWLDLSENEIEDVSPLSSLDSLHYVNLKRNSLESINALIFACSDSIHVNVAENYITDFTYLFSVHSCSLLLEGMGVQSVKNAPIFDVYQLCADMDADGVPVLNYRGYTNMEDAAFVECGTVHEAAVMDGDTYTVTLSGITETTKAYLGNGTTGDSTYVVPPANLEVEPGESLTFATGLPEGYSLRGFSPAQQGTMEIDRTNLVYTPAEGFESEEYMFAYYEGMQLRGFSKVTVRPEVFVLGDANGDGHVRVGDVSAILNYLVGLVPANFKAKRADANGDGKIRIGDASSVLTMIVNQ